MVNDKPAEALVDSGATISILNRQMADSRDIFHGRPVLVQAYDASQRSLDGWAKVKVEYQGQVVHLEALVMEWVEYDFLLSRPHRKAMRLNLYWNDKVSV